MNSLEKMDKFVREEQITMIFKIIQNILEGADYGKQWFTCIGND